MWLIISSLSLHLLFYCILSILALIWLGPMVLFCAAVRRESVPLSRFPFFLFSFFFFFFTARKFFTLALADGFPLEFEWQQVPSGLQDSAQYSGRSQQWYDLDGLESSSDFQFFHSAFPAFGNRSEYTNYNWYHCHFHVQQLFSSQAKSK